MARITVEDCLDHIDQRNRFHLALIASRRARQLHQGAPPLVEASGDDFPVLALREVASGQVTLELLDQVDQELEGSPEPASGEPSAESVAEAAEALGAGMAAGMGGSERPSAVFETEEDQEGAGSEEEAAPEEPELQQDPEEGSGEEPEDDQPAGDEAGDEEG